MTSVLPLDGLRIDVLGPLAVRAAGVEVTPRGRRPRDLLAVLTQRPGRAVPAEVLLDLVWGSAGRDLDGSAVHTVVARLRRALGPGALLTAERGYTLSPSVVLDADAYAESVSRSRAAAARGDIDATAGHLRAALAIWSGPVAYGDVSDDLVLTERTRLHESRTNATEDLADALLALGDPHATGEALELSLGLAEDHPLRERTHRLAMLAAYRSGRQADALGIYRSLAGRLRRELGVDPSPATARLHALVLDQDPGLDPPDPTRSARVTASSRRREPSLIRGLQPAPLPQTTTVGREQDLQRVLRLLTDGRRLVSIVGPGGVGKTRLLAELARHLTGTDLAYIDLGATARERQPGTGVTVQELAETIILSLGSAAPAGPAAASLVEALAAAELTLLVDEAEDVVAPLADLVRAILDRAPGVRVVTTSRVPLEIVGESRVLLAPLAGAAHDADTAGRLAAPATRLLVDRLTDHAPDLVLSDQDIADLARIARQVDGLPLALEIIAGHAATCTIPELGAMADTALDVVTSLRDHSPRHRSLRETVHWSVARLEPAAALVLSRLAVFVGAFDAPAARAVVGPIAPGRTPVDTDEHLRALVREALLQVDRTGAGIRLRMLRTVRDYALELLTDSDDIGPARRRHREWHAARWRGEHLHDALLADVGDRYPDYLAALQDALAARDGPALGDLAVTLGRWWLFAEAGDIGGRWLDQVVDSAILAEPELLRVLTLRTGLRQTHDYALDAAELAARERALAGDPEWAAVCAMTSSIAAYVSGDYRAAIEAAGRLLELARTRVPHQLPEALAAYAAMAAAAGQPDAAVTAAAEAWSLIAGAATAVSYRAVVPKIALALTDAGEPERAYAISVQAITQARRDLGLLPSWVIIGNAGWAALGCGNPAGALHWFALSVATLPAERCGLLRAEFLSGAAAAAGALALTQAPELAEGARLLRDRHHLVLSPWQQGQLHKAGLPAAAAALPAPDPAPGGAAWASPVDRDPADRRLVDLLVAAAAAAGQPIEGGLAAAIDRLVEQPS